MARELRPAALAFDLDGTIYLADRPLRGAVELLSHLRDRQIPYLFATNNSSVPASRYVERLGAMGVPAQPSQVITSNDVAIDHLGASGIERAFLVATPEVRAEYAAAGVLHSEEGAEAVVLTFDVTLDYQKIVTASALLRRGLPYYATHLDLVCPTPSGPIPDAGSFDALLRSATGREPTVLGKPSAAMATTIRQRLSTSLAVGEDDNIAFVGDRLYTDMRMANEHGFAAILTLTGEATAADLAAGPYRADLVVNGLHELHSLLAAAEYPTTAAEVRH